MRKKDKKNGFTLIELLVVISIIGLLSSIVLSALVAARTKAQYAKVNVELKQIINAIIYAQGERGTSLLNGITYSGCTDCVCRVPDPQTITNETSSQCYINWTTALTNIQNATNGVYGGLTNFVRDPWGRPYMLDENESEGVFPCGWMQDTILSAGPNGVWEFGANDDLMFLIPHYYSPCP